MLISTLERGAGLRRSLFIALQRLDWGGLGSGSADFPIKIVDASAVEPNPLGNLPIHWGVDQRHQMLFEFLFPELKPLPEWPSDVLPQC